MTTKTYKKDEPDTIRTMFNSIAQRYDRGNAILSFNMHRLWNRKLVKKTISRSNNTRPILLDLCAGTGDIAFDHLKKIKEKQHAYLLDFSEEMLLVARDKAQDEALKHHQIEYITADAQDIPLLEESVEAVTIAYGIRNVQRPQQCFNEIFRVLKAGGRVGILELSRPKNILLRAMHRMYLKTMLPLMGKLITSNGAAYDYLSSSIYKFVAPHELRQQLEKAGFNNVQIKSLMGGIATIITADKPQH
jgi:demethylmenaquinone methyltransferase/2-methoxy-6-polyprenyl-1,4-benzoquinol methylase